MEQFSHHSTGYSQGGKREKERNCANFCIFLFFTPWLYLGQKIVVSLGKQSIWCINGNFTLEFHYILTSHSQRYTSFPYPHLDIHWFFYTVCMAQYMSVGNTSGQLKMSLFPGHISFLQRLHLQTDSCFWSWVTLWHFAWPSMLWK